MKIDTIYRFSSNLPNVTKVATRVSGVPFFSSTVKNDKNCSNNDEVTRVVTRNV